MSKSLIQDAGVMGYGKKSSTQDYAAKYWGTLNVHTGIPFTRLDGTISVDKTRGFHSRPGKKQTIRNANRALTKRARAILKRKMHEELLDTL